jgi:hypothetical protein
MVQSGTNDDYYDGFTPRLHLTTLIPLKKVLAAGQLARLQIVEDE